MNRIIIINHFNFINKIKTLIIKKIMKKEKENSIKYKKLNNFWKIRRGSNFNAYQRKNLGSIPSKIDNFIFKLPEESKTNLNSTLQPLILQDENLCFRKDIFRLDHKSWKNFGSGNSIELKGNSFKFSINNTLKSMKKNKSDFDSTNLEPFKTIYSNTNNSTAQTVINKDNKEQDSTDKNNNDFENSNSRVDKNISLSLNRYRNSEMKSLFNTFNKEERYDNVYYQRELLNKYYPGPGEYEIDEYTSNNLKKGLRYDSLFKSKSSFPLRDLNNTTYKIGPGSYNNFKKKQVQGGTFSKLKKYDPFEKNKDENSNIGPGWLDLPGGISIRDKNKMNHYFMIEPEKEENLEKKYGIERIEKSPKNKDVNKFGEFNAIPRWSQKEKTKDFNNDWINKSLEKKIKEEKLKGNIIDLTGNFNFKKKKQNIIQDKYYWAKMNNDELKLGKEEAKKKKGVYTFSKIPKLVKKSNHVPGPGYYEPEKILNGIKLKKEFNSNLDMNWI